MTARDAMLQRTLRGVAHGDFDLHGIADVGNFFDKLRDYRAQLPAGHVLKECRLPDEQVQGPPSQL